MKNTFKSITGIEYTTNELQTRFYTIDAEGKKTRISRKAYEEAKADYEAWKQMNLDDIAMMDATDEEIGEDAYTTVVELTDEEWEREADAERKAREDKMAADAKATEDAVNGLETLSEAEKATIEPAEAELLNNTRKEAKAKKEAKKAARKPRKSKDIFHTSPTHGITLTAKQVDFMMHLSDSTFWDRGLDSTLWVDVLCDEIGGQFAGKPMTVGAMVSTLCEKGLAIRGKDALKDQTTGRSRKATHFTLTELGKEIAKELGL